MLILRIALAALGAFVAYFGFGGLAFGFLPSLRNEFLKYPAVYRSQEGIKSVMPAGMAAMFIAMIVLAVMYAMLYDGGSGVAEGARFGVLIGVFAICALVVHNYVNFEYWVETDASTIRRRFRRVGYHRHRDWPYLSSTDASLK